MQSQINHTLFPNSCQNFCIRTRGIRWYSGRFIYINVFVLTQFHIVLIPYILLTGNFAIPKSIEFLVYWNRYNFEKRDYSIIDRYLITYLWVVDLHMIGHSTYKYIHFETIFIQDNQFKLHMQMSKDDLFWKDNR